LLEFLFWHLGRRKINSEEFIGRDWRPAVSAKHGTQLNIHNWRYKRQNQR
jgi:hypothetical protein